MSRRPMTAPVTGMVLAAGLGTRMRPITDRLPKPLVTLGGRTLLDHAIDRLAASEVERVVVNLHYKPEMIAAHLAERRPPAITLVHESELHPGRRKVAHDSQRAARPQPGELAGSRRQG